MKMKKTGNIIISVLAIIFLGLLITGAVLYKKAPSQEAQTAGINSAASGEVNMAEHILGNPDANISMAVYFDINCHYCRIFHQTMQQIVTEYGKDGQINWIARHFPIFPISDKEAEASECIAELGGNEAFWSYLDKLMTIDTPAQDTLTDTLANLTDGIDKDAFKHCLESGKYAEKINGTRQEAINLGAQGTPFIVITDKKQGTITPVGGALSYEEMKQVLDGTFVNQ